MIYSPSSTSRLIQIVHGSLGHISQTTEKSSFTFGFTFQTHHIRNNIQICIIYIFFFIMDLVVLDFPFGYTPWFFIILYKLFNIFFNNNWLTEKWIYTENFLALSDLTSYLILPSSDTWSLWISSNPQVSSRMGGSRPNITNYII